MGFFLRVLIVILTMLTVILQQKSEFISEIKTATIEMETNSGIYILIKNNFQTNNYSQGIIIKVSAIKNIVRRW